jgi:hypothetical protein
MGGEIKHLKRRCNFDSNQIKGKKKEKRKVLPIELSS